MIEEDDGNIEHEDVYVCALIFDTMNDHVD